MNEPFNLPSLAIPVTLRCNLKCRRCVNELRADSAKRFAPARQI